MDTFAEGKAPPARALGVFIRQKLNERGMNVRMLSLQSGVKENTLGPYVKGTITRPDVRTLQRISVPLKVSFEALCRVAADLPEDSGVGERISPTLREVVEAMPRDAQEGLAKVLPQLMALAGQLGGAQLAAPPKLSPERAARRQWLVDKLDTMADAELDDLQQVLERQLDPDMRRNGFPGIRVARARTAGS